MQILAGEGIVARGSGDTRPSKATSGSVVASVRNANPEHVIMRYRVIAFSAASRMNWESFKRLASERKTTEMKAMTPDAWDPSASPTAKSISSRFAGSAANVEVAPWSCYADSDAAAYFSPSSLRRRVLSDGSTPTIAL